MLVRISFRHEGRETTARLIIQYFGAGAMHEVRIVYVDDSPVIDGGTQYYVEAARVIIRGDEAYVYTK